MAPPPGSENTKLKVCATPLPLDGDTETEDGGPPLPVILNVADVVWLSAPLVPVTVTVELPTVAPAVVLMVKVVDPEPDTEGGLKLGVAPDGRPDAAKLIAPLNPLVAVAVTV